MPLDADQELLEHRLRVSQMLTNIEQMNTNIDKMRADMKADRWKVPLQVTGIAIGMFAAATYFGHLAH